MADLWENEFEKEEFSCEGRRAIVVFPKKESFNSRWLLKTEYFGCFPELEKRLLRRGYTLAHLENKNRCGTDEDTDARARFADAVTEKYRLSPRHVPVGMSCGGLQAVKYAAKYPEKVSVLYLDAPVINLLSWPFSMGKKTAAGDGERKEFLDGLGLSLSEMIAYREHPLDKIPALVARKIPVVLTYGDADGEVPYEENGIFLERAYKAAGLPLLVLPAPGRGHHPHGPREEDMTRVIGFIESHDR